MSFAAFFWICDIGFQRSIEVTVNDASRTNLETIHRLLTHRADLGDERIQAQLRDLSEVWANGALFEVADENGNWIFRPVRFTLAYPPLPPAQSQNVSFFTANLDSLQYRIALQQVQVAGKYYEIHAAVPTEPFDQALDHFRLIEKEALPLLVLLASLLGYWLSGWSLAPVKRIIETAESIGAQNLSRRLEVPRARDELRQADSRLSMPCSRRIEISVNQITQFTADASHDLRTPVAVMRTTAEIALRRPRTVAEYRNALSKILATSLETSELLENLLTLARADAGALGMDMHRVDLGAHVRKAQERAALLSAEKNVNVTSNPANPVWVTADAIAIDRLLLILLDNAVKYTPPGGRCEIALSHDQSEARISVRDSGIGIAQDDLKSIFDRFYRADRARSKNTGGAGLGLAIARWIAQSHGGMIAVESTPGAGSVFRVSLPAGQAV